MPHDKSLLSEVHYNELKELTHEEFRDILEYHKKLIYSHLPKDWKHNFTIPSLIGIAVAVGFGFFGFDEVFYLIGFTSFILLFIIVLLNTTVQKEVSEFSNRSYYNFSILKKTSSYDNYIQKHLSINWENEGLFSVEPKIPLPPKLYNFE
jgi:hypothetical protein